jgi:hypothetical protein
VAVFTTYTGSDEITQSEELQLKLLIERLEKVIFDGMLDVRCDPSKLDSRRIKEIAKKIEFILTNKLLIYNFDYEDKDLDFGYKLIKSNIGLPHLKVIAIGAVRKISQKTLLRNISEKNKKYRDGSISLVIAAFTDMGISQQIKKENNNIVDYLEKNTSISAFVWIDRIHPSVDGWTINIIYNKKSKLRLQHIFKNENHVLSNSDIVYNCVIQETGLNQSDDYDIAQKFLTEANFSLKLENKLNHRWYCHWTTPINHTCEIVKVI